MHNIIQIMIESIGWEVSRKAPCL